MSVSSKKKCQSFINAMGEAAQDLQAAVLTMKDLRSKYIAQGVDPTGTPLENNVTAASDWIDDLETLANSPVANGFIAAIVPSHRGRALEG